jgi:hypothetical protein
MSEEKLIYKSIAAAMNDVTAVGKNGKNTMQNYKFRGVEDVYNSLHPILAKHKLFSVPEVLEDVTEERTTDKGKNLIYRVLKIKYSMFAEDGSSVSGVVIGEGMDTGDKAANKSMSIGHKYFLSQLFCIPTAETTDGETDTYDVEPKKKAPIKVENPEDIPSAAEAAERTCPTCNSPLAVRTNKAKGNQFYGCTGKDANGNWCRYTESIGKPTAKTTEPKPPVVITDYTDEDIPF